MRYRAAAWSPCAWCLVLAAGSLLMFALLRRQPVADAGADEVRDR